VKRVLLAGLPLALAVAVFAYLTTSEPTAATYRTSGLLARFLAAAGCFIAASQFDRGDYMRRAWMLIGLAYAQLLANALLFGSVSRAGARELSSEAAILSGFIVVAANASIVIGAMMVAHAWKVAGLSLMVTSATRRLVTLASASTGLLVAGPALVSSVQALLGGHLDALTHVASALGDIATLSVLGPILLTALALRGGALAWPWSMLVVGTLGWLVYDGTTTVVALLGYDRSQLRSVEESLRMFACASYLSAGMLQALVVAQRTVPEPSPAAARV
jgi:hypothetical protein